MQLILLLVLLSLILAVVALLSATASTRAVSAQMEAVTDRLEAAEEQCAGLDLRVAGCLEESHRASTTRAELRDKLDDKVEQVQDNVAAVLELERGRLKDHVSRTDEKLARIESAVETVNESVATAKSSQDEVVEQVDARLSEALASVRSGLAQQEQGRESMAADTRHLISEMAARVEALAEEANRTDRGLQALEIDAGQMRQDIDKVASYVEEVFQTRLGDTMQAFDGSVMDMLRGIRSELLRGVRSIEGISTVVAGGATTTKHLLAGSAEDREAPEGQDDGGELKPEADLGATEPQGEQDAEIPPPPQGEPTALHAWHSMAAASAQSS